MTTYTTYNDKNGKPLFFHIADGKKKKISRTEYEASQTQEAPVQLSISEQNEQFATENKNETTVQFAEIVISDNLSDGAEPEYKAEQIPVRTIVTADEQSEPEVENNIEVAALSLIQQIVEATNNPRKLTLKITKNFALILYRNCSICGLMYNKDGEISKISFMGKTPEARKKYKSTRYDFNGLGDIDSYRDEIIAQVGFVDYSRPYENRKTNDLNTHLSML